MPSHEATEHAFYRSHDVKRRILELYDAVLADWPVKHEFRRVPTSQGETFVVECGAEGKPPVILLHGSVANSATWMGEAEAWADDFKLYVVDIIGEPGHSAPSRPDLNSDAYATWLDELMRELRVPSVPPSSAYRSAVGSPWISRFVDPIASPGSR